MYGTEQRINTLLHLSYYKLCMSIITAIQNTVVIYTFPAISIPQLSLGQLVYVRLN